MVSDVYRPRSIYLLSLANNLPLAAQMHKVAWIPSIVMSAAAVEAYVNDVQTLVKAFSDNSPKLAAMVEMLTRIEDSKGQTMLKFESIMFALTGLPMDRGREPFQSLDLLMDIRNRIVHGRTVVLKADAESQTHQRTASDEKFIKQLEAKKLVGENMHADWMDLISNREAGYWALLTAYKSMKCVWDLFEASHPSFHAVWEDAFASLKEFAEINK